MAEAAMYQLVDTIPEVWQERQAVRRDAEAILESRRGRLEAVAAGLGADAVAAEAAAMDYAPPLPVDALSTAHKVLEAGRMYGVASPEHSELRRGLVQDCQRLLAEWYRKKKPEYFPPVRHIYDEASQEFFSHGLSIQQMTKNALTPIRDDRRTGAYDHEEEARRVNEHIEDATPRILRRVLGAVAVGEGVAMRTISECTEKALADYESDQKDRRAHTGYNGYVPEIKKQMIRDIKLDGNTSDRFEEQIGLPGDYISPEIVRMALERRGAAVADMTKTELHGSQLLVRDDLLEFAAELDAVASEQWNANIFMGEVVPADHPKNYATFRQEALARQESLKDMAETVANFTLDLAADNFDRAKAPRHVENFVKSLLLDLAKHDSTVAEQMFNKETAQRLDEVRSLEARGLYERAFSVMEEISKAAPGGGYCGGSSCGLESVDVHSDEGKRLSKFLNAKPGDKIERDKERKCRVCGNKSVVYAYNSRQVNKGCLSCETSVSEQSRVVAQEAA